MTEAELAELVDDCPVLFHMAEHGAWPAIRQHGLLSKSRLLDVYGVTGPDRTLVEATRRPVGITLSRPGLPSARVRDQTPMDDAGLRRCLTGGMTPQAWYRLLNGKVFFWLSRARLDRLLSAQLNRGLPHDVLEIATAPFVATYRDAITLSPINSGSTRPFGTPRGPETFRTIADYDYAFWRRKRKRGERAVELAVEGGVPDIARFVTSCTVCRS